MSAHSPTGAVLADGKPRFLRLVPLGAAAVALSLWGVVALWVDVLYADYREAGLRAQAATMGASAASGLGNALNQRLALVRGLAAFVTVKLDSPEEIGREFPIFAAAVHETVEGVRNMSISPGFVVGFVYPADPGNLKVIGNDLLADKRPGFVEAVRRAIDRRGMAVHEPVTLIQGGLGLIARHAVFQGDEPWGAVGMVFSVDPLLANFGSGLERYRWGLRTAGGTQVGGDMAVFAADPVTARIQLPEGYWELGLVSLGGWQHPEFEGVEGVLVRMGLAVTGMALALAVWDQLRRRMVLQILVADRTKSLSSANAELARFAYVAAHDLQEPLRTITSYSQLVQRNEVAGLSEQGRTWLDEVISAARRMKALLSDIQIYLAEQDLPPPGGPIPAGECLDGALRALAPQIEATGAVIEAGTLPAVLADRERLTQVLLVLLSNALEYRSPERAPSVQVSARREGRAVAIDVTDNGIGIEPAYHDRIFQVFQRLHGRDEHLGTGMGLAIARKMVERLGGRLAVRSEPGTGSTFTILLPRAKGQP